MYRVLVCEVLLRRSRAKTVARVSDSFFETWPTADALAEADPEAVRDAIRPLGLVSRAEQLVEIARKLTDDTSPAWDASDLKELRGVGEYAARATVGEPVVDAVSARVYRRYFGMFDVADHREVDEPLWDLVELVTPKTRAREWNWAVLDLAADVCLPQRPRCGRCPVVGRCDFAAQSDADTI